MRRLLGFLAALFILLGSGVLGAQEEPPEPLPLADEGGSDIVNFLLLGSDTYNPLNAGRTDVVMIVSVNRTAGTVAFLSIPRDLWVYLPGNGMQRINAAFGYGEHNGYEGGGPALVADTIEYNFGISIDHFARVDFNDFKEIIDNLGGIDIAVDCGIEDWRLREPDLDPALEENWEVFTLPIGVQHMDGDLALWYVRSRRTTNDLDRGRRQQAVMRAIWHRLNELGLLHQLSDIWPQVTEIVRTDISLPEMLDLVPLAAAIDSSRIASYVFRVYQEIVPASSGGASVLVVQREPLIATMQRFLTPPTENQLVRESPSVEIVNGAGWSEYSRIAADRLALEGFVPEIVAEPAPRQEYTAIYDYTGDSKSSSLQELMQVLRVSPESVIVQPDPDRAVDFRVVIGNNYRSCNHSYIATRPPTTDDGSDES